jgi:arylsulfatase
MMAPSKFLSITFPIVWACTSGFAQSKTDKRPNILLILADDMGYSDLSCYGGEINTPNIDKLASEGIKFTNFYNAARSCPTRASLLTGLYPHQAGIGDMVYRNDGPGYYGFLNENTVTLAEVLKSAGYLTMMSGKWHVGHEKGQWPEDRGFEDFYGIHKHVNSYYKVLEGCDVYYNGNIIQKSNEPPVNNLHPEKEWYTTDVFTDYALKFLDEAKNDNRPYFLYLPYNSPHFPLEAPDEDIDKYRNSYDKGWDVLREEKLVRMKKLGIVPANTILSPSKNPTWSSLSAEDRKELAFRRAIYAAQVDRMDQNIGRVIAQLKKNGQYDNTLIIFLSDNGCSNEIGMFGLNFDKYKISNYPEWKHMGGWSVSQGQAWANVSNAPFRMYKMNSHQGGIATPLIMNWPADMKKKGLISKQVGHIIDIMPTLAELAQVKYPSSFNERTITPNEGISLVKYFRKPELSSSRILFWEHLGNCAIREGDFKLVKEYPQKEWELYNLKTDPNELINLTETMPDKVKEMDKEYQAWATRALVRPYPVYEPKKK